MKATIISTFLLTVLTLTGCGKKVELKEKYCGVEIAGFEVINIKSLGDKGYDYSDDDNKLAGDIMDKIKELYNTDVRLAFVSKDQNEMAMYILGPSDTEVVEKISCYLLVNDFDGRLPETRKLLFYADEHSSLVAAVKTKDN